MNKKYLLITLMFYKFAMMNLALFILSKYTSLGDNEAYTSMRFITAVAQNHQVISFTTSLTQILIYFLNKLFFQSSYLVNLFFNMLSFIGITLIIDKISLKKDLPSYLFVALLFLPNFNLWSSIAGKEALLVFFSGFIIKFIVIYFESSQAPFASPKNNIRKSFLSRIGFMFILGLILLYKPAFAIFLIPLLVFIYFHKFSLDYPLVFYFLALGFFIFACYLIRSQIDNFTLNINDAFPASAHSNRENIWTYHYAFFYTLPYTMWVSLWGPLWGELNSSIKALSFGESAILFLGYLSFFVIYLKNSLKNGFNLSNALVLIFSILLCVLTLTAMGYINPGTAIRYRANNYMFLLVFFYYLSRTNGALCQQTERNYSSLPIQPGN